MLELHAYLIIVSADTTDLFVCLNDLKCLAYTLLKPYMDIFSNFGICILKYFKYNCYKYLDCIPLFTYF